MLDIKRRFLGAVAFSLAVAFAAFVLGGCTADEGFSPDGSPELTNPEFVRTPPPVLMPEVGGAVQVTGAAGASSGFIDVTNAAEGYVAVSVTSPEKCVVRIIQGTADDVAAGTAGYDDYGIDSDGAVDFYPITRGDGHYTVILYYSANSVDPSGSPLYNRLAVAEVDVALTSEFAPYLIPSRIVGYTPDSACVALSHEITQHCATDLEVVQQIYAWVTGNIRYDTEKAEAVRGASGYEPDPDETLASRSGICYDYAALTAAMLRANGIPTRLVKGNVQNGSQGTVYHAWNMVWLEDAGWVAVGLAVNQSDWTRIDATFAAGGDGMGSFIGDGKNYTDLAYC